MNDNEEETRKKRGNSDVEGMQAGRGEEETMEGRRVAEDSTGEARPSPKIYTAQDIAHLLKLNADTIYRKLKNGELPKPLPFSRLLRWNGHLFDKWVEDGCPRVRTGRKKDAANGAASDAGKKVRKSKRRK